MLAQKKSFNPITKKINLQLDEESAPMMALSNSKQTLQALENLKFRLHLTIPEYKRNYATFDNAMIKILIEFGEKKHLEYDNLKHN